MTHVAPLFLELETYIAEARRTLASGEQFSLADLDSNIEKLCNMVLMLSQEEQMMYEVRLQDLLSALNALGLEMKAHYDGDLLVQHRNASVAYKTADSRDNFGKRDEE